MADPSNRTPGHLPVPRWLLPVNRLLVRLGLTDAVRVRGRTTGALHQLAANVLVHEGRRYLVAPRGNTQWVRNVRAAGGCEVRQRGGAWTPMQVREVPAQDRGPLIDAYVAAWGWQVGDQFHALPDAADHPVFELTPASVV